MEYNVNRNEWTMVNEKNIEKTIKGFIAKEMAVDPESITRATNLVNDLNADSLDVVNVVTAIEAKYNIIFPIDSDVKQDGYTLKLLIDGVMKALQKK